MSETKFTPLPEDVTDEQVDAVREELKKVKIDRTPKYDEEKKKKLGDALKKFTRGGDKE